MFGIEPDEPDYSEIVEAALQKLGGEDEEILRDWFGIGRDPVDCELMATRYRSHPSLLAGVVRASLDKLKPIIVELNGGDE